MARHEVAARRPERRGGFWLPWLLLSLSCAVPLAAALPTEAAPSDTARQPIQYMIVVTGGELLAGAYADGHTHFLTRTLRGLGLQCVGSMTVDDRLSQIKAALRFATAQAPLVIVTGGLGPTDNDVTRAALSEFTKIPLREDSAVLARMRRRLHKPSGQLGSNLRRQARVPTHGTFLPNPVGTAVGLVFDQGPSVIVALPGPPRELQPMVRQHLVPYLSRRFGTRLPGCSLTLRFVDIGQSRIDQTLKQHVPLPGDIVLSSQFVGGRVDFTFALPDDSPRSRQRLDDLKQQILRCLGDYVYADDGMTLEQHVVDLLAASGQTLSLVEVGSGGKLTAALSGAGGADRVRLAAWVAPSERQLRKLLPVADPAWADATKSAERTRLLAEAAADQTGSGWAIAVGPPQPDQGQAQYVNVVLRQPDGHADGQRIALGGTGETASARLTTRILDQLWRRVR